MLEANEQGVHLRNECHEVDEKSLEVKEMPVNDGLPKAGSDAFIVALPSSAKSGGGIFL